MVDSIELRLHNLQAYPGLMQWLISHSKRQLTGSLATVPKNEDTIHFYLREALFEQFGKVMYDMRGEKVTSSHYTMGWHMPLGERCQWVDFNFSIPKLIYGTNVLQFVPHRNEFKEPFIGFNYNSVGDNERVTFERLMFFIQTFFDKFFNTAISERVDLSDVEILRIDLCWEQFFHSKEDALSYLEYQKKVHKKYQRKSSKRRSSYATSVFMNTRDYACKIYHKGTEYCSKDGERKKHLEANRMMRSGVKGRNLKYDVEKIQAFADKILRYEITFRRPYMAKIYWRKVFRKYYTDTHSKGRWADQMRRWSDIASIYRYAFQSEHLSKEIRQFFVGLYMGQHTLSRDKVRHYTAQYRYKFKYFDISNCVLQAERKFYLWWLARRDLAANFFCKVSEKELKALNNYYVNVGVEEELPTKAFFSSEVLRELFKVFNEFVRHFEIKEKTLLSDVDKRLDSFNEKVKLDNLLYKDSQEKCKTTMHVTRVRNILALLEHYTLEELVQRKLIDRTTAWRYTKRFNALEYNFRTGSSVYIWNCRGFREYHDLLHSTGLIKYTHNAVFDSY